MVQVFTPLDTALAGKTNFGVNDLDTGLALEFDESVTGRIDVRPPGEFTSVFIKFYQRRLGFYPISGEYPQERATSVASRSYLSGAPPLSVLLDILTRMKQISSAA